MVTTFKLNFITNFGERIEISVPRANINTTEEDVIKAMDGIINSGIVLTSRGRPTQRLGARLLKTQSTDFVIK